MSTKSGCKTNDDGKEKYPQTNSNEEGIDEASKDNEQDFFSNLQKTEKEQGLSVRGKGHGWTTFVESLLGDW